MSSQRRNGIRTVLGRRVAVLALASGLLIGTLGTTAAAGSAAGPGDQSVILKKKGKKCGKTNRASASKKGKGKKCGKKGKGSKGSTGPKGDKGDKGDAGVGPPPAQCAAHPEICS